MKRRIITTGILCLLLLLTVVSCKTAPTVYQITYELDGGTFKAENPTSFVKDTVPFVVENPERKGYNFTGWTDNIGTDSPVKSYLISPDIGQDIVLYANWTPIVYTIEYIVRDFSIRPVEEVVEEVKPTNPVTYTIETPTFTLLPPDEEQDMTFVGWIKKGSDPNKAVKDFKIVEGSTGNRTICAVWDYTPVPYLITYDLGGGKLKTGNPHVYDASIAPFVLEEPTRDSYIFLGWKESADSEPRHDYEVDTLSHRNLSFTAVWEPITYSIKYDLGGGVYLNGLSNPSSYNAETDTFTLINPYRYNYQFLGWMVLGDPEMKVYEEYTVKKGSHGNIVLTAQWEWKKNPVGNATILQQLIEEFGENGIPRPDWVIKVPEEEGWHYERGYGRADGFYDSQRISTAEAVTAIAEWAGIFIRERVDDVNGAYSEKKDIDVDAYVFGREIVEYWVDSTGGVWTLVRVPVDLEGKPIQSTTAVRPLEIGDWSI